LLLYNQELTDFTHFVGMVSKCQSKAPTKSNEI
jgi:hypothetical protein